MLIVVLQYFAVFAYLSLPRLILAALDPRADMDVTRGWLDRRFAYASLCMAVFHVLRWRAPRSAAATLLAWLHVEFAVASIEASVLYVAGIGYSPLFFYHLGSEATRIAVVEHWPLASAIVATMIAAQAVLHRILTRPIDISRFAGRVAVSLVVILGARSIDILYRHVVPSEIATWSAITEWHAYQHRRARDEQLTWTPAEQQELMSIVAPSRTTVPAPRPPRRRNLITIYLEGFQANFSGRASNPPLMPNLDRFAASATRFTNFYNAVTPTINAVVSSQCGTLTELENTDLESDHGVTRNIECLPDILHTAGYYQVFLGGADSRFSGKKTFMDAHGVDDVWGWERWSQLPRYAHRPNEWGLDDNDLVREAEAMLPALRERAPFHMMLLTVDTHPPGFVTPGCRAVAGDSALLNAVRCTDAAIGQLLDTLAQDGDLQNTVIEIMGDHMMFPSPENRAALGSLSTGWFGRVFMSIAAPGLPARAIETPSYTPDLAAIALDALGFNPVPGFAFGRSSLRMPIANRELVARSFEVVRGEMVPSLPTPGNACDVEQLSSTTIDIGDGISACEREKLIEMAERITDQE